MSFHDELKALRQEEIMQTNNRLIDMIQTILIAYIVPIDEMKTKLREHASKRLHRCVYTKCVIDMSPILDCGNRMYIHPKYIEFKSNSDEFFKICKVFPVYKKIKNTIIDAFPGAKITETMRGKSIVFTVAYDLTCATCT
jgi:hypothetical protein